MNNDLIPLINILNTYHTNKRKECMAAYQKYLVQESRMESYKVTKAMVDGVNLDMFSRMDILLFVYALQQAHILNRKDDIDLSSYIGDSAYSKFRNRLEFGIPDRFPYTINYLTEVCENEYLLTLNLFEIEQAKANGILKWKQEMQRETVGTVVGKNENGETEIINHIHYEPKRSLKIAELMIEERFYPPALRWHIVDNRNDETLSSEFRNGFEVDRINRKIILYNGYIAEIDGQHRNRAIEYALRENPRIKMNYPIILTIGTTRLAQQIIEQDEERVPINRRRYISEDNAYGKNCFRFFKASVTSDRFIYISDYTALKVSRMLEDNDVAINMIVHGFPVCKSTFIMAMSSIMDNGNGHYKGDTGYVAMLMDMIMTELFNRLDVDRATADSERIVNVYKRRYQYMLHPSTIYYYVALAKELRSNGGITANLIQGIINSTDWRNSDLTSLALAEKSARMLADNLLFM